LLLVVVVVVVVDMKVATCDVCYLVISCLSVCVL